MRARLNRLMTWTAALAAAMFLCLSSAARAEIEYLDARGLQELIRSENGRPVVVNFFATWCPPCRAEIPMLVKLSERYRGKILFVGLTVDDGRTIDQVPSFLDSMGIKYPVYRAGTDLCRQFGLSAIPFNAGYRADGRLAWSYSGLVREADFTEMVRDLIREAGKE